LETIVVGGHDLGKIGRTLFFRQGRGGKGFVIHPLKHAGQCREKGIVEHHDIPATAPVILQGLFADLFGREVGLHLLIEQLPVGIAETVDTLFHVSHDQVIPVMRQAFFNQRTEVIPLHPAGVLELVYHIMVDVRTGLFIDEGGIAPTDHLIQQFGRVGYQHHILFFPVSRDLAGNIRQDSQCIVIAHNLTGRIIGGQITEQGDNAFDTVVQPVFKSTSDDLPGAERGRLRKASVQVVCQADKGG